MFGLIAFLVFSSCSNEIGKIIFVPPNIEKSSLNGINTVRFALYIDTARPVNEVREELEAVRRFTVSRDATGKIGNSFENFPLFDYVILSGGQMRLGSVSSYLILTDDLKGLLVREDIMLQSLQNSGVKILLGIKGGNDGVSIGSLPHEVPPGSIERNRFTFAQWVFARHIVDTVLFYGLNGTELWDVNGEGSTRNPYPIVGETFFNGESSIKVEDDAMAQEYWKAGGNNFADVMSHIYEEFGASSSFQGDFGFEQMQMTPVILRESNFGRYLPSMVPRYEFASTQAVITVLVNDSKDNFGYNDEGVPGKGMDWFTPDSYSPIIIDLAATADARLQELAEKIGRRTETDGTVTLGDSEYGLVYVTNLVKDQEELRKKLSILTEEVFSVKINGVSP